jgi:hypothetical protein
LYTLLLSPNACCIFQPTQPAWFDVLLDLIRDSLQVMKVSPIQFLQPSVFWSKYFSYNPVLKHPQRRFLCHYYRRRFKLAWNTARKQKLHRRCAWLSVLTVHVALCEVDGHAGGHRNVTSSVHPLRILPGYSLVTALCRSPAHQGPPLSVLSVGYAVHSVLLTCLSPTAGLGWTGKNIQVGGWKGGI